MVLSPGRRFAGSSLAECASRNVQSVNLTDQKSFSLRAMVQLAGVGIALAVLFRAESTNQLFFLAGRLFVLGTVASLFFLPRRWMIFPLMLLMVTMPDLTQAMEDVQERGSVLAATAWQIGVGPLSPAIIVMGALMVAFVRLNDRMLPRSYLPVILYFCVVPVGTSLFFGYALDGLGRFATDAKLAVFFCAGLLVFSSYYRRHPDELWRGSQIFLALTCGVVALDTVRLFLGVTAQVTHLSYVNLSLDSTKGLIVGVIFWLVARIIGGRNLLLGPLAGVVTLSVMLAYQTRWLVVVLILGMLLVFLLLGWKRLIVVMLAGTVLSFATLPFIQRFFPQVWEVTAIRFRFVGEIDGGTDLLEVESARTGAIYNALHLLWDRHSLLTGMGYGSWYTDAYSPMPNLTDGAFDEESLSTGRYYRVHDFFSHFIFKYGLIGLLLYTYVLVRPLLAIWRIRTTVLGWRPSREIAIVVFGMMPLVLTQLWFSGKGLFFSAWFVVMADSWAACFPWIRTESAAKRIEPVAVPAGEATASPNLPGSPSIPSSG